jgi:hypothetical protein
MSRAIGIADELLLTPFVSTRYEAAGLLRQQEAVIRQMLDVLEHCNKHGWMLADYEDKMGSAIDAAKGVL